MTEEDENNTADFDIIISEQENTETVGLNEIADKQMDINDTIITTADLRLQKQETVETELGKMERNCLTLDVVGQHNAKRENNPSEGYKLNF